GPRHGQLAGLAERADRLAEFLDPGQPDPAPAHLDHQRADPVVPAGAAQAREHAGQSQPAPGHARGQRLRDGTRGESVAQVEPAFVLVLEGAARAAIPRLPSARPGTAGPLQPGEVRVVEARGSGDDAIVAVVHELSGRRVVVTADRELRARCAAAGAEILGPGWLLGLLREPRSPRASRE